MAFHRSLARAGFAALAFAVALPGAAQACSIIRDPTAGPAQYKKEARQLIAAASAVVDGEVVRPFKDGRPALVRAHRVLRGPQKPYFEVGERHSCDIALTYQGERLRLILVGGPDLYYLPVDQSNARHEDRLLRSDRRKAWPYRQGTAAPAAE